MAAADATAAAVVIAAEVARLLADGEVHDRQTGLPRRVRPGDIAILFRSRASHREIEAALESRAIPTYVYKGLGFFDADEVKDLVALLRYLAQPSSPLCGAALLRSRFVRLSDRGVRLIAPRAEAVLSGAEPPPDGLSAEDRGVLDQLRASLADWLPLVDRVPPSELLDRIVADAAYAFELRGARRPQARENLKKIRAMARRLQNRGYATMARVAEHLARLSAGDESNAAVDALDSVNLMTVHAAKGLEFPIVFVTNLHRGTGGHGDPVVIVPARAGGRPLVSVGGSLPEADEAVRERDREETKRLLYVAVTRARERLYLGAVLKDGRFQARAGSLGEVLPASLRDAFARAATGGVSVEWRPENGGVRLLGVAQPDAGGSSPLMADRDDASTAPATPIVDVEPLIDTMGDRHVAAAAYARSLAPSFAGEPGVPGDEPAGADPALVGTLVHRLFQVSGHDASGDAGWLAERARAFASRARRRRRLGQRGGRGRRRRGVPPAPAPNRRRLPRGRCRVRVRAAVLAAARGAGRRRHARAAGRRSRQHRLSRPPPGRNHHGARAEDRQTPRLAPAPARSLRSRRALPLPRGGRRGPARLPRRRANRPPRRIDATGSCREASKETRR